MLGDAYGAAIVAALSKSEIAKMDKMKEDEEAEAASKDLEGQRGVKMMRANGKTKSNLSQITKTETIDEEDEIVEDFTSAEDNLSVDQPNVAEVNEVKIIVGDSVVTDKKEDNI